MYKDVVRFHGRAQSLKIPYMSNITDYDIEDIIIDRPVRFSVDGRNFQLYPLSLGRMYMVDRLIRSLEFNGKYYSSNAVCETMRICNLHKDIVCRIIAVCSFRGRSSISDDNILDERQKFFEDNLDIDEAAELLVFILTRDYVDDIIRHFGIDRDTDERKRIAQYHKTNSDEITHGGHTVYGTVIDFACERYGWTFDYVVWGISYANLRMLMMDVTTSSHLSKDERRKLGIRRNANVINGDDPRNREIIKELMKEEC